MLRAKDCKDLRENGHTNSGVYEIYPFDTSSRPVSVYCDMETMNGGWTVIQKRVDGSLSFERNWADYKNGFGTPEQNVWIGNDVIHQLTKGKTSSLYVSITTFYITNWYELYDQFSISNETEKYKLFLEGPAMGTLGDSMLHTGDVYTELSGMYFTTSDRDNDRWSEGNCAVDWRGGWWFHKCHQGFLNGPWSSGDWINPWFPTLQNGKYIKETLMMVKRH
ncbi:fibroleukin-like [Saccostrea echinata]|uniref:fibroleukin-like n=1 Tax=Saccostrea echinata TaxID=191078 RepID=UPI002A81A6A9|nr:fibroleukin-like [Saccostrea echinata]